MDPLGKYRAKRLRDATPEPAGVVAPAGGRRFVVQKHAARRLHYDFRLELGGVLVSWAVPKGPSYEQANKRVAIHVEDHPVEYADFEGVIPAGNYGAGAVIVWDRGVWEPVGDAEEGLEKGKLLFDLRGYKLRGRWTLVKIRKSENDWLLIKERDALEGAGRDDFDEASVLSGLTLEELGSGADRAAEIEAALDALDAPRRALSAADVRPMLAEPRPEPFDRDGWIFELKYDGWRIVAGVEEGLATLRTRNGADVTARFPEIARALAALPCPRFVVDGEAVVHDDAGKPSFQRLQQRAQLRRATDIERAALVLPATLYAFDLLGFDRFDLRPLPLRERKRLLRRLLPAAGPVRYSDHVERRGRALYAEVERLGLEGVVAKRADSPYRAGRRSADWIKVRSDRTDTFAVVGYMEGSGSRAGGLGSLHLATRSAGEWLYAGRVGSGLDQAQLARAEAEIERNGRAEPVVGALPASATRGSVWCEPTLRARVRYKEWTQEGLLRQPVLLELGPAPPEWSAPPDPPSPAPPTVEAAGEDAPAAPRLAISNPDKVFWPGEGYTKADLVGYYRSVAPALLPYLRDRPVVLTRYPDGIDGKSFFQKDAPAFAPAWLRRVKVWSEDSQRELSYFVVDDEDGLAYLANMASIPLHIWSSRVGSLERPDWCILDLDPKEAPFAHVVEVARALHRICDDAELPVFVKTSGSTGLHVLVPLGGLCTHEQARMLGELLARVVVAQLPGLCTITRAVRRRGGKVYVDYLQNGYGKLLVAPFSVRPLPGAPVSAPLRWSEVTRRLDLADYTIRSMPRRLAAQRSDPWAGLLGSGVDLVQALSRLQSRDG